MSIAKNIKNFKVLPSVLSQSTSTTSRIKSTRLCGGRTARPQTRRKVIYGGVVMDTETSNVVPSDNSLSLSNVSGIKRIVIDLPDNDTERVNIRLDKENSSVSETATTKLINDLKKINEPENTIDKLQKINENINISETEPTAQVEESPEFATETSTEKLPEFATETSTEKLPEFTTETSTEESTEPDTTVQVDESEKPETETQTEEATESDTAQSEESSDVEQSENSVQEPTIIPDTTNTLSDMVSKTVDKAASVVDSRKTISTQLGGKSDYSAFIDNLFTQTVGGKKRVYSQKAIDLNDKTTEIIKSVYPNITHEELKAVRSEIYQHIRNKYDPEVFKTLKDYEKAELLLKATTPSVLKKIDIKQAVIDRKRRIEERFNSDEETPAMSKKTASKKKATTKKTDTKKATTKKATTKKETKTSKAIEKLKKKKSTRGGADLELPFHI